MSLGASYGVASGPRRQYISTEAFNNDFFTYTVTTDANGLQTGTFTQVADATTVNCPAGRVLRDNGKRLHPGAHPNVTYAMIGVFDPQTFLSGYINPNSPIFAMFNSDKAYFADTDLTAAAGFGRGLDSNLSSSGLLNEGLAVFTNGNVIAGKQVYSDKRFSTTGAATATVGFPTASTINVAAGQLFYFVNPTADMTIHALNCSTIGTHAYVFLSNATLGSSINFGTGFRPTALVSTGVMNNISSLGPNRVNTIHFMGDGFGMTEVGRTINLSTAQGFFR
jgi:hypothetical protein